MKFRYTYFLLAAVILVSCERKLRAPDMNGTGTAGLIGDWKFVSTGGTTIGTSEIDLVGDLLKIEAILNYTSDNPKGTYKITSSTINASGVAYDFSGKLILNSYENNILQSSDTTALPVSPYGPLNNTTGYKTVGTDSIAFTSNPPFVQLPNGGTMSSPGGCRYKIEGNRLTMTLKHISSTTSSSGGIATTDKQIINVTLVLER